MCPDDERLAQDLEMHLDHDDEHPTILFAKAAAENADLPPWNWSESAGNGGFDGQPLLGKIITIKYGDYTKRIWINGTTESLKEAIKSVFRLRTNRAFWLEDEEQTVYIIDKDIPLGKYYTLHVDLGVSIRVCHYDDDKDLPILQEDKIFYKEEDFKEYLARRGWTCLREIDGFRDIDYIDHLQPGVLYRGMR